MAIKRWKSRGYFSEWDDEVEDTCKRTIDRSISDLLNEMLLQYIIIGKKEITFDYKNRNYIIKLNVKDDDRLTLDILEEIYNNF